MISDEYYDVSFVSGTEYLSGSVIMRERLQRMPPPNALERYRYRVRNMAEKSGRTLDPTEVYLVYSFRTEHRSRSPFYIGKGTSARPRQHFWDSSLKKGTLKDKFILSALRRDEQIFVEVLFKEISEELALALEMFLVAHFGRIVAKTGCLTNFTEGGEGASGLVFSDQSRAKMRNSHLGVKFSPERLAAHRAAYNNPVTKSRMSAKKSTPERVLRLMTNVVNPLFDLVAANVEPKHSLLRCRSCGGQVKMRNTFLLRGVLPTDHFQCATEIFDIDKGSQIYGAGRWGYKRVQVEVPEGTASYHLSRTYMSFYDESGNELQKFPLPSKYVQARIAGERKLRAARKSGRLRSGRW